MKVCPYVNGSHSEQPNVTSGVPQRSSSVLGPLLFITYINELPEAIQSIIFADDTKLYR